MTEFVQFYDSLYGEEENPRFVTKDKVYGFISHQTHCAKLTKKDAKIRQQTRQCKDLTDMIMTRC